MALSSNGKENMAFTYTYTYESDTVFSILVSNEGTAYEKVEVTFLNHGTHTVKRSMDWSLCRDLKSLTVGDNVKIAVHGGNLRRVYKE